MANSKVVHLGKKEFKCDICDQAFSQKSHLNRHVNTVHKKLTRISCDLCDCSSYLRTTLEIHSKAVHLGKKEHKCDICDNAFSLKNSLKTHVNTVHKNLTRYNCDLCDLCDYSSYFSDILEKHYSAVHLGSSVLAVDLTTSLLIVERFVVSCFCLRHVVP
jgi:uncharacterized Zn-finger protein